VIGGDSVNIAERIKRRRAEMRMSTYQVGASTGISPSLITMYENQDRNPSFSNVIKLAKELKDPALLVDYICITAESADVRINKSMLEKTIAPSILGEETLASKVDLETDR